MKIAQKEKVINYINKWGSITSYEAYSELGVTQLRRKNRSTKKRRI